MTSDSFVRSLSARLDGAVAADGATLAAYSTDASNHRLVPRCVVFPRRTDDVIAVVEACASAGVSVTSRGAGTGLAGSALGSGVVLDYSRWFDGVVHVDAESRRAVVEPGVVLDSLQRRAAPLGLRFGPDPATHSRCTLGGMIGTNACGARALAWGTTSANVRAVDVVLADGSTATLGSEQSTGLNDALRAIGDGWSGPIAAELGRFSRQVSGYALQHLLPGPGFDPAKAFVGSEGTWGQVVRATVDLVEVPPNRTLVVAGFSDIIAAAAAAPRFPAAGVLTVEGMSVDLVDAFDTSAGPRSHRPSLPAGSAWLLIEVGGTERECAGGAEAAVALAAESGAHETRLVTAPEQQRALWAMREQGTGLASRTGGAERWPGWEDAAVPPQGLAAYLADFTALMREHGRTGSLYGHFGEGCVHVRIDHDLVSESGRRAYAEFQRAAADLVVAHGGSLSGEHGDGRQRSELLAMMYSRDVLAAFAAAKAVFDPGNLFNPGLIVDPVPLDADLRLSLVRPHTDHLSFAYSDDGGDFASAQRRCVGVGSCRASGGGMCPSYQATLDERHSTRGRARVLFEMLDGSLASEGWQSPDVLAALDLCLMCKACSSECPVSVDMATYKAEFLHQHYRARLRPRSHLSMGWLPVWLAMARRAPRLANTFVCSPRLAAGVKRLAGIDPRRELPALAAHPARRSARRSKASQPPPGTSPVVLWLDTFTCTFSPDVVDDAVAVLRAAGRSVDITGAGLCCGLTWLSTGQLSVARVVLAKTIAALDTRGVGTAIVVLEPSCAAALRDDAVKLLDSAAARRVSDRIRSLAEVLDDALLPAGPTRSDPRLGSSVVAQFHCHQRATSGTQADRDVLSRLGFDVTSVEEGCCGLAGNFGFEDGHYDVSTRCAEQSFLPYLTRLPAAEVLADGFSCRLQMDQLAAAPLAGRRPVHLATLVRRRLAL